MTETGSALADKFCNISHLWWHPSYPKESIKVCEWAPINGRYLSQFRDGEFLFAGWHYIHVWHKNPYNVVDRGVPTRCSPLSRRVLCPVSRIKNMAIILNSMGTKDRTTRIFIFFHAYLGVRKYFRRVHKRDVSECNRQWHTAILFAYLQGVPQTREGTLCLRPSFRIANCKRTAFRCQ